MIHPLLWGQAQDTSLVMALVFHELDLPLHQYLTQAHCAWLQLMQTHYCHLAVWKTKEDKVINIEEGDIYRERLLLVGHVTQLGGSITDIWLLYAYWTWHQSAALYSRWVLMCWTSSNF